MTWMTTRPRRSPGKFRGPSLSAHHDRLSLTAGEPRRRPSFLSRSKGCDLSPRRSRTWYFASPAATACDSRDRGKPEPRWNPNCGQVFIGTPVQ
jgi:hypothetical protein